MKPLFIGELLNSYCNGYFGSSAFGTKEVVAWGKNWLLCRVHSFGETSYLEVAEFSSNEEMLKLIEEWRMDD